MQSKLTLAAVLALAAAQTVSCKRDPRAEAAREIPAGHDDRIRRGEYLATIGGCNDCHTPGGMYGAPDGARRLSGSDLGWRGPWGTTFPPNLTPDAKTGLGNWTEEDIVKAVRTGVRPDGRRLLPPMPWPNYAHLSDDDAHALAAYLKSLPRIEHRAPAALSPDEQASNAPVALPPPPAWDAPRVGGGPPSPPPR